MALFENFAANRAAKKAQDRELYEQAVRENAEARQQLAETEAQYARLPEILDEVSARVRAEIDADRAKIKADKLERETRSANLKDELRIAEERLARVKAQVASATETPEIQKGEGHQSEEVAIDSNERPSADRGEQHDYTAKRDQEEVTTKSRIEELESKIQNTQPVPRERF